MRSHLKGIQKCSRFSNTTAEVVLCKSVRSITLPDLSLVTAWARERESEREERREETEREIVKSELGEEGGWAVKLEKDKMIVGVRE